MIDLRHEIDKRGLNKVVTMLLALSVLFIVGCAITVSGCVSNSDETPGPTGSIVVERPYESGDSCNIHDYGNGVYYFPCVGEAFAESLANFSRACEITAITGDGTGGYGYDRGYFVTCESPVTFVVER